MTGVRSDCNFMIYDKYESVFAGLEIALTSKLHGQHLVQRTIIGHIKGHLWSQEPSKALVLSFHGLTGVGKNFVSNIIADNIYKGGMHSPYVHLISATKEFPHEELLPFYKVIFVFLSSKQVILQLRGK